MTNTDALGRISFEESLHPVDWFRFEEPFKSKDSGRSYVSREDAQIVLRNAGEVNQGFEFYRLHGNPGDRHMTPVTDSDLVGKLREHRERLLAARKYDQHVSHLNAPFLPLSAYSPNV